jgi:RNA polymerase sigma-70 factor (ECF subfamily)
MKDAGSRTAVVSHDLESASSPHFDDVYAEQFAFVWRTVRRLGIAESAVEDLVQEVFVVVHRRLSTFEGKNTVRSWLYGIVARVVRDARRSLRRKPGHRGGAMDAELDTLADVQGRSPEDQVAKIEALRLLYRVLDAMSYERRELFVLAELEGLTVVEIAGALGMNVNTIYSRLRAARAEFEHCAAREVRLGEGRPR